jgi:hypothetical protein
LRITIRVVIKPKSIFLSHGNIQDFNTGHFTINLWAKKDPAQCRNLFEPFQFSRTTTTPMITTLSIKTNVTTTKQNGRNYCQNLFLKDHLDVRFVKRLTRPKWASWPR